MTAIDEFIVGGMGGLAFVFIDRIRFALGRDGRRPRRGSSSSERVLPQARITRDKFR